MESWLTVGLDRIQLRMSKSARTRSITIVSTSKGVTIIYAAGVGGGGGIETHHPCMGCER